MYAPSLLLNVFTEEDIELFRSKIKNNDDYAKYFYDEVCMRWVMEHPLLDEYFSKKLEPLARRVFGDETLKTAYTVYSIYDSPASNLPEHRDKNACDYNISYVLTQDKGEWAFYIDNNLYMLKENEGIAYSGTKSLHRRPSMSESGNTQVEMIFFHFASADSWIFGNHCNDFYPEGAK